MELFECYSAVVLFIFQEQTQDKDYYCSEPLQWRPVSESLGSSLILQQCVRFIDVYEENKGHT